MQPLRDIEGVAGDFPGNPVPPPSATGAIRSRHNVLM